MGGVCCGLRERLEEERQDRQEGRERPERPEILPTKEEAFEKLLAERKKITVVAFALQAALRRSFDKNEGWTPRQRTLQHKGYDERLVS